MRPKKFLPLKKRGWLPEDRVEFQELLPLKLKNSVSGKGDKEKQNPCVQEMMNLFSCLKKNEYNQSLCSNEVDILSSCHKDYDVAMKKEKEQMRMGLLTPEAILLSTENEHYLLSAQFKNIEVQLDQEKEQELEHSGRSSGPAKYQTVTRNLNVDATTTSEENTISYWRTKAKSNILSKVEESINKGIAKNVILFLGDGMSVTTLAAARIYMGQLNNETGENSQLSFEKFPYSGFSKTYCVDKQVADSACSSVAYLGGVKANYGTLGVTAAVSRSDCTSSLNSSNHVDTILSWAQNAGKATGVVTTTRITHASPAGNYAHTSEREWESDGSMSMSSSSCTDIAYQMVYDEPGKNCKVLMGGGRSKLLPQSSGGSRKDGTNLVTVWEEDKTSNGSNASYVTSRDELLAIDVNKTDYLMGLFQSDHMLYHLEDGSDDQPTLAEMTEVAIKILSKERNGFYLFVEGGKIDIAHHSQYTRRSLDETVQFQNAIQVAVDLLDEEETLIVVTADHAHTLSMSGYPDRGYDILGDPNTGSDNLPYTTLNYANGPSAETSRSGYRKDISSDNFSSYTYQYPSLVPLGDESHGGEDVAVYAKGPWAHLFSSSFEQSYIPFAMAFAANIGPGALRNVTSTSSTSSAADI